MRLSDAMEAGYAKVGKQCFGAEFKRRNEAGEMIVTCSASMAEECCALGAVIIGSKGDADWNYPVRQYVLRLNDNCHMPIPEIVETLRGMGL